MEEKNVKTEKELLELNLQPVMSRGTKRKEEKKPQHLMLSSKVVGKLRYISQLTRSSISKIAEEALAIAISKWEAKNLEIEDYIWGDRALKRRDSIYTPLFQDED